jgi:hypothetical protein
MTSPSRGLDLSNMTDLSPEERAEWADFYKQTLGHAHIGLDFWVENDPETLKRYRLYSDCATPNQYESSRKIVVFGYLPYYALIGYDVGVRYLIHTRQKMGMTREQILEGIAISFLVCGPAGMETIARALERYEWIEPEQPAEFPDGWASDPASFSSGLDFSVRELEPGERELVVKWYEETIGEVPRYVTFLLENRPELLKAYRNRFEHSVKVLPKQIVPTTLLHYNVIRGFRDGIREDVLLARAFGVEKELVLNTIGSASLNGSMEGFNIVDEAAGDIFAQW